MNSKFQASTQSFFIDTFQHVAKTGDLLDFVKKNTRMIETLLQNQDDVVQTTFLAAKYGHLDVLEYLLNSVDDNHQQGLINLLIGRIVDDANLGHLKVYEFLFEKAEDCFKHVFTNAHSTVKCNFQK